jgi:hypothetical protein
MNVWTKKTAKYFSIKSIATFHLFGFSLRVISLCTGGPSGWTLNRIMTALCHCIESLYMNWDPQTTEYKIILNLTLKAMGRSARTFSKPITQKILKCKKSAKNIFSTENFCWIYVLGFVPLKNVNLCLFQAWKMWVNSIDHLSRPSHFCPQGGWVAVGVGGKQLNRANVCSRQKRSHFYLPIIGFIDLWALFLWTKRCSILYVDSKKREHNWNCLVLPKLCPI